MVGQTFHLMLRTDASGQFPVWLTFTALRSDGRLSIQEYTLRCFGALRMAWEITRAALRPGKDTR